MGKMRRAMTLILMTVMSWDRAGVTAVVMMVVSLTVVWRESMKGLMPVASSVHFLYYYYLIYMGYYNYVNQCCHILSNRILAYIAHRYNKVKNNQAY